MKEKKNSDKLLFYKQIIREHLINTKGKIGMTSVISTGDVNVDIGSTNEKEKHQDIK